jgi:uncharacterized protein (TIRG00374 family)
MSWIKTVPVLLWLAALILVGWVLGQLPLAAIAQSISTLSALQWLAWIGLNLGIILLATQRWRVLSDMLKLPVKFGELLMIRQAGQAVSFITPGPQFGGEPLQIFWLWKRSQLPIHSALLALGLDRFYELWINFGMLSLGVLLLLASPASDVADWQEILLILALILLMLSVLGWLMMKQPEQVFGRFKRVIDRWRHHPRLQHIEIHRQGLGSDVKYVMKEQKPALLRAFILSLCGWAGLIAELWLLLSVFDLALDFSAFLVILVSMRLAFLLPLPGGVGSLEAVLFWVFQYLSLSAEAAIGLIALMRLRDVLVLMAGLWCLRVLHSSE